MATRRLRVAGRAGGGPAAAEDQNSIFLFLLFSSRSSFFNPFDRTQKVRDVGRRGRGEVRGRGGGPRWRGRREEEEEGVGFSPTTTLLLPSPSLLLLLLLLLLLPRRAFFFDRLLGFCRMARTTRLQMRFSRLLSCIDAGLARALGGRVAHFPKKDFF